MFPSRIGARLAQAAITRFPVGRPRVAHFIGNLGDDLAPHIVGRLLRSPVVSVRLSATGTRILAVGSVLSAAGPGAIICGAGAIEQRPHAWMGEEYLLVRGPLTAGLVRGTEVPRRFGDPALLAPELYGLTPQLGRNPLFIPHYVDFNAFRGTVPSEWILNVRRVRIAEALRQISEAEIVVASSLHGLILAHAFQKPTIWIEPSEAIKGGRFKFEDYFESQDHSQMAHSLRRANILRDLDRLAVDAPTVRLEPIREAFGILRRLLLAAEK